MEGSTLNFRSVSPSLPSYPLPKPFALLNQFAGRIREISAHEWMKTPRFKVIDTFVNWIPEAELETWLWWLKFFAVAVPLFLAVVTGALNIAAIRVNDRVAEIKTQDAAAKEEKANQERDAVKARLASTQSELGETKKAAISANKRAEALEEKQRDRTLSLEQRAQFVVYTAQGPKGRIRIKILMSETGEPRRFALLLKGMFESAGFIVVEPMLNFMVSGEVSGLWVKFKNADSIPKHAGNLQAAFQTIGIELKAAIEDAVFHSELEDDMVTIYVYKKE